MAYFYLTKQKTGLFCHSKRKAESGLFLLFFATGLFVSLLGCQGAGEAFAPGASPPERNRSVGVTYRTELLVRSGTSQDRSFGSYRRPLTFTPACTPSASFYFAFQFSLSQIC